MQEHIFHQKRTDAEEWCFIPHLMLLSGKVLQGWKQTSAVISHFKWAEVPALAKERCLALEASRTSSLFEQTHLWPQLTCFFLLISLLHGWFNELHQGTEASRAPGPAEGRQREPWLRKEWICSSPSRANASLRQVAGYLPLKKSQPNSSKLQFEHCVSFASEVKVD